MILSISDTDRLAEAAATFKSSAMLYSLDVLTPKFIDLETIKDWHLATSDKVSFGKEFVQLWWVTERAAGLWWGLSLVPAFSSLVGA